MFGVLSASLAEGGFIGARTIFEGPDGFIRAHSFKDAYDYSRITENLGKKWEMMDTSIKVHACCRFAGPVADCALDLYRQGVRSKDVKGILAKVNDWTIKVLCTPPEPKYRPMTHVDAQFSLPYTVAVAISRNRTGPGEFKEEVLGDPEVIELASKITWKLDPAAEAVYPKAYSTTLVATLNDGREVMSHVDYPRGDPENPVTVEDILNKFNLLTENYYSQRKREKIVEGIKGLETVDNLAKIGDLIR
jgi:2-methylcitrate dehydratase PrpD